MRKMSLVKKMVSLGLAAVMSMSMAVSAFAAPTEDAGKVNVQFSINSEVKDEGLTIPSVGYTQAGVMYNSEKFSVDIGSITKCPIDLPEGFKGEFTDKSPYVPTAFDAIYPCAKSLETLGSGAVVTGLDEISKPNGIYFTKISGLSTYELESTSNYWKGYSWSFYAVPSGKDFNPASGSVANKQYLVNLYANNVQLEAGYTYYMVYELNETTW